MGTSLATFPDPLANEATAETTMAEPLTIEQIPPQPRPVPVPRTAMERGYDVTAAGQVVVDIPSLVRSDVFTELTKLAAAIVSASAASAALATDIDSE